MPGRAAVVGVIPRPAGVPRRGRGAGLRDGRRDHGEARGADGGVWNNLATAWDANRTGYLAEFGAELDSPSPPKRLHLLAMNASKRPEGRKTFRILSVPLIAEVAGLLRFVNVMYWSTVEHRERALHLQFALAASESVDQPKAAIPRRGAAVVPIVTDISHDHWRRPLDNEVARQMFYLDFVAAGVDRGPYDRFRKPPPFDVHLEVLADRSTAPRLRRLWLPLARVIGIARKTPPDGSDKPTSSQPTLSELAAGIPTTLSRVSRSAGMILLLHGYLSAWRAMATVLGDRPMPVLDMNRFAEIAGVRRCRSRWIWDPRAGHPVLHAQVSRDNREVAEATINLPDNTEPQHSAKAGDQDAAQLLSLVFLAHGRVEEFRSWCRKVEGLAAR